MISIILPFYNSESYISESINSVLSQHYKSWELLLINDGSTDTSKEIALSFRDPRIRYFEQENKGVAAARNVGLAHMKGDYFCFLDADDVLPPNSLASRLLLFEQAPYMSFVDGVVQKVDVCLQQVVSIWRPSLQGTPLEELIRLNGTCFLGLTWLIKRKPGRKYRFKEGLSHGEDLLFFMELAREGGQYAYTEDIILHYRNTPGSAMKNLKGLERGYRSIEQEICQWPEITPNLLRTYKNRWRSFMAKDYIKRGQLGDLLGLVKGL
ncbi:glycosyltransferase family 2 protein [Cytophagales bacterium LB-30]|uniref:Glycosyltransferase family 2 protein n=1 Tax=Shiella aurantiaca TaxID=3058365 RepID=A0ABT8F2T4_9BACT|nr:glycosyltransferase family 2 protein [Shiella aurantiaca]MDN4164761.1 glycosyltransferase family 2 protein [Shiella aurantiaca]